MLNKEFKRKREMINYVVKLLHFLIEKLIRLYNF